MITDKEILAAERILAFALAHGASDAAVDLSKSESDIVGTLDGKIDKIARNTDTSVVLYLFVDGRYGSCWCNAADADEDFVLRSIETVRLLEPDPLRRLPRAGEQCKTAITGLELGLYDPARETMDIERKCAMALDVSITGKTPEGVKLLSEEGEYSDSVEDQLLMDSRGLRCRHTESSYEYFVSVTVEGPDGEKYEDSFWDADPHLKGLDAAQCGPEALRRAVAKFGSRECRGGSYTMVVERDCAYSLLEPLVSALYGGAVSQRSSFLRLGERICPEGVRFFDDCHLQGQAGGCLFDNEGMPTSEEPLIEDGTVQKYLLSTYYAGKLGLEPTNSGLTRGHLMPFGPYGTKEEILKACGNGIFVTGFNGGNTNPVTGDFSFGVEGFLFRGGKIGRPIDGMLVTGNMKELWRGLLYAGSDALPHMSHLVPTLAFKDVRFN